MIFLFLLIIIARYKSVEGSDEDVHPETSDLQAVMAARRAAFVEARIRAAADAGAPFRPQFVTEMMKQRAALVGDTIQARQDMAFARIQMAARRRQVLKNLADSSEPLSFGLLMRSMHKAYGLEMAKRNIEFNRYVWANLQGKLHIRLLFE